MKVIANDNITKHTPCAIVGFSGITPLIDAVSNKSQQVIGLTTQALVSGTTYTNVITSKWVVFQIDTSSFSVNDILFAKTDGTLTNTPDTSTLDQPIALVRKAQTDGQIVMTLDRKFSKSFYNFRLTSQSQSSITVPEYIPQSTRLLVGGNEWVKGAWYNEATNSAGEWVLIEPNYPIPPNDCVLEYVANPT